MIVRRSYKIILVMLISLILLAGMAGMASVRPYRRGAVWRAISHQSEIVNLQAHFTVLRIVHSGPMPFAEYPDGPGRQ